MTNTRLIRLLALFILIVGIATPLFSFSTPSVSVAYAQEEEVSEEAEEAGTTPDSAGAAVAGGIIALVVLLIIVVVIISAVSLGVIGIGAAQVSASED